MAHYDYDLFVIGAGSGGVRAARVAALLGAKVAIAEQDKVGGTCVLRGCVPKKLLAHAAHFREALEDSVGFGWRTENVTHDWPTLIANVTADTEWLSGIYIRNLERAGAELIHSRAFIEDRHTIRLHKPARKITARHILIATGGSPRLDSTIPGNEHAITSNEVFKLKHLPKRIVILGGSFVSIEFAGVFAALGSDTTVIYRGDEILRGFDSDIRKSVRAGIDKRGVKVITEDTIVAIEHRGGELTGLTKNGDRLAADKILVAIGRNPNVLGFGLTEAGVALNSRGAVAVDRFSRTNIDNIYAVGDVTDRLCLTPVAIREGEAVAQTLFGGHPAALDYEAIPEAVFSQPEAGTIGLSEEVAKTRFPSLDIYRANFIPLPNRVAKRDERMMMKLVVDGATDRVLGCHIVGPNASELVQVVAVAIKMGATKADFDRTVALHPTAAEELLTMREPVERYRREAAE